MKRAPRLAIAAALSLAGCRNEREQALRAEIAARTEERVEISAIESARDEADAASADLSRRRAELDAARAELAQAESERDAARAAFEAEVARGGRLQAEVASVAAHAQQLAERGRALDADLQRERERAGWVRDQAAVLAREIRAGDPAWTSARRLGALAEFAHRVAEEYPGDPDLALLAAGIVPSDAPSPEQARAAAASAARIRDRFEAVYELPASPAVAKETP